MSHRSEADISEAIQECARECVGKPDLPAHIRQYCEKLIDERHWSVADAAIVEEGALRVVDRLKQLLY